MYLPTNNKLKSNHCSHLTISLYIFCSYIRIRTYLRPLIIYYNKMTTMSNLILKYMTQFSRF